VRGNESDKPNDPDGTDRNRGHDGSAKEHENREFADIHAESLGRDFSQAECIQQSSLSHEDSGSYEKGWR
jgi:hypothetical protein